MRHFILMLLLFSIDTSYAHEPAVTLREHLEALIQIHNQQAMQQRQDDRLAIETALRSEIRIKDEETKSRYALKEEVSILRDRQVHTDTRIAELEGSKINQYVGILIIAVLGIANLIRPFWKGK